MSLYQKIAKNVILPSADIFLKTKIARNVNFLKKTQWLSEEELNKYQTIKMKKMIHYSYENVPFYHKTFRDLNIYPSDIKTIEDLTKLPVVTKQTIKDNFNSFLSVKYKDFNPYISKTGGTTGKPFQYMLSSPHLSMMWATGFRAWGWGGYNFGDRRVTLSGTSLLPNDRFSIKSMIRTNLERHLPLSSIHLSNKVMHSHISKIKKFNPDYLRGFPSALYEFSNFVKQQDINLKFKSIFSTAEMLYPHQRKAIEEVFESKIFNNYSNPESGGNANECNHHNGFHLGQEWSICEFADNNHEIFSHSGEKGEMIFTNLHNMAMPMLRYCSEDLGVISDSKCSCGRGLKLLDSIDGRISDNLRFSNGVTIPGPMIVHIFRLFPEVLNYQLVQSTNDSVDVNIVKDDQFTKEQALRLEKILKYNCGENVFVKIKYVDSIKKTLAGKKQVIIINIDKNYE